ncbi:MAG TPA: hypothetical protein VGA56_09335, partial [Opitutaceae bacterium]
MGRTKNRQQVVDQFPSLPDIQQFLLSLKGAGSGLNLSTANFGGAWGEVSGEKFLDLSVEFHLVLELAEAMAFSAFDLFLKGHAVLFQFRDEPFGLFDRSDVVFRTMGHKYRNLDPAHRAQRRDRFKIRVPGSRIAKVLHQDVVYTTLILVA